MFGEEDCSFATLCCKEIRGCMIFGKNWPSFRSNALCQVVVEHVKRKRKTVVVSQYLCAVYVVSDALSHHGHKVSGYDGWVGELGGSRQVDNGIQLVDCQGCGTSLRTWAVMVRDRSDDTLNIHQILTKACIEPNIRKNANFKHLLAKAFLDPDPDSIKSFRNAPLWELSTSQRRYVKAWSTSVNVNIS